VAITTYELRFEGLLDARDLAVFDRVHITSDATSVTVCARIADPEALEGLLVAGRQLGLRVVTVRPLSG
jgi:hypothetical protein